MVSGLQVVIELHLGLGLENAAWHPKNNGLFPPGFKLGLLALKADARTTTLGKESKLLCPTLSVKTLQIATPLLAINHLN